MPNLLEDISFGSVPFADELHTLICQTCEDMAGSDSETYRNLHLALVRCIANALLGECGRPLTYDPSFISDFVAGVRPPGM